MRQFFITVFGTILGLFIFFILMVFLLAMLGAALGSAASTGKNTKSGDVILTLDLREPLRDHSAGESLFGFPTSSVVDIARSLDRAKSDGQVKGLFIRANEFSMVPASAEEIRLAILDFQQSGKPVITHSQGFEGTSIMPYMAVSASDEIWQQDTSNFSIAGIRSEMGFYGGVFEKYDVKAQFEQFHEYKNAANIYKESGLTAPHREATTSYLTSLYDTALAHIAKDRGLEVKTVTRLLKAAPHSAETAQDEGLIDKLGHLHAAKAYIQKKAGGEKVKFRPIKDYAPTGYSTGPAIAFIGGQGTVVTGGSQDGSNPFSNSLTMGSDTISTAIDKAVKDKKVKAIVFRVSTPGGSPSASDQIHDAIARSKEAGKPVVISMGQYAASGGYYVAANADKIVALPTTITGSIGVLGGKIALRDTFAKIGYNIEDINIGGEPLTKVQEIAKGRVWTGAQGKPLGLVDEFGGFMKAVDMAKSLAEIDKDTKVYIKRFPRPKTPQQQLEALLGNSAQVSRDLEALREIGSLPEIEALIQARKGVDSRSNALLAVLPYLRDAV